MGLKLRRKFKLNNLLFAFAIINVLLTVGFVIAKIFLMHCDTADSAIILLDIGISLSTAYLMSYVFYLVVFIPDMQHKKSINKFIALKFAFFIKEYKQFIYDGNNNEIDFSLIKHNDQFHIGISKTNEKTGRAIYVTYQEQLMALLKAFNKAYHDTNFYFPFLESQLRDIFYGIMFSDFIKYVEFFEDGAVVEQSFKGAISELNLIKPKIKELEEIIARYNENR